MPHRWHPDDPVRDGGLDVDEPLPLSDVRGPGEDPDGLAVVLPPDDDDGYYVGLPLRSHCKRAFQRSRNLGGTKRGLDVERYNAEHLLDSDKCGGSSNYIRWDQLVTECSK